MKYLLSALLICGAFFSQQSISQQTEPTPLPVCDEGETVLPGVGGCGSPAAEQSCTLVSIRTSSPLAVSTRSSLSSYNNYVSQNNTTASNPSCQQARTNTAVTSRVWTHDLNPSCPANMETTVVVPVTYTVTSIITQRTGSQTFPVTCTTTKTTDIVEHASQVTLTWDYSGEFECPDNHPIGPVNYDDGTLIGKYCYRIPEDEPPPPVDCENDPLNPCPSPPCVRGGNGMMVCKDNPEDKCWVDEWGHTQCQEGCGFVGETFFCATQPDPDEMPSFDKCKFTFNGYACPSEPDDDVPEPDKPLPDMKKQDFKDVNIGVETRQNVTNDLLQTLISTNISESENLSKTLGDKLDEGNAGLGQANAYLKQIDINTNAMADDIAEFTKQGEIEPLPPEPESWYESEYENGLKGIWEEKQPLLMATPLFSFVEQFNINPNGNPPDFEMCFNLGAMGNYGCDSFEVPQWIWNAIKVFILFTAAILCRAAVTGV
tara:strand:- start:115 stop:1575 length:1461 start_codon:yes stop_codon:yes gene_type:complete